ncbi:C39 family peptidase [Deinococcus aluminii]|uniref:Peptidase C39 domain-containing protein n=1 Tax=Deinococcus aluminii TaxID=1656885 RepID=A0ABP9XF04_9DEIO
MRFPRFLLAALTALSLSAQATTPAPALALQNVPVVLQGYNDCGPASIAMVLGYYGLAVNVKSISQATKPSPNSYMSVAAINGYVSRYGLRTVQITGSQIGLVKNLITLGVPTIVLQYYREVGKVPHFRVVRGYDDRVGRLYLADPLIGYAYVSYQDFDQLWNTQGRVAVAVYPPNLHARVMQALGVRAADHA